MSLAERYRTWKFASTCLSADVINEGFDLEIRVGDDIASTRLRLAKQLAGAGAPRSDATSRYRRTWDGTAAARLPGDQGARQRPLHLDWIAMGEKKRCG
ncbi:hypothetical protein ACXX9E_29510 [Pseudomonas sp. GNP014]